jgi:5-methylcytosine-specific restriction endonuclease McrBC GTP-binding regulatory subunit McrB
MCFLSVISPENATENEYLIATAIEIKNTDFLPGCLPAT